MSLENRSSIQEVIKDFEQLVEELIKDEPNENHVKQCMLKLGMAYETDSASRIGRVLDKMNRLIFESSKTKGSHDLR